MGMYGLIYSLYHPLKGLNVAKNHNALSKPVRFFMTPNDPKRDLSCNESHFKVTEGFLPEIVSIYQVKVGTVSQIVFRQTMLSMLE